MEPITIKLKKKYVVIIRTGELTASQLRRLDNALTLFANQQQDIVDAISLNLHLEGIQ